MVVAVVAAGWVAEWELVVDAEWAKGSVRRAQDRWESAEGWV